MRAWAIFAAIAGLVVVGVIVGYPFYARASSKSAKLGECKTLEAELAILRIQGGDQGRAAQIQAALAQCAREASDLGVDYTAADAAEATCTGMQEQIAQEFAHFKATDYADIAKRGTTRGAILRIGSELNRCLQNAAEDATTVDALRKIDRIAARHYAEAIARRECYLSESPGCGRYLGSVEDAGSTKAAAETSQVIAPLIAIRREITAKISRIAIAELQARKST